MRKTPFILLLAALLICSCVSDTEHQKVIDEKNAQSVENEKLKNELDELKFGAPNLLADGKKFYAAKDFSQARQKFQTLVEKHPDMPQAIEAKKFLANIDEEEVWNNASMSDDISFSENYISQYPKGKYISIAIKRRNELKAMNEQKAYEAASTQNTSYGWKKFLEDYPHHQNAAAIKEKIIRLEVNEISGQKETGTMPSFNQYNSNYSSISSVSITNNTGCELIVRYSGPDAKMITITSGGSKTVSLSSGNYKIAASACGANYAGTESLSGEYGSTFYITTTRY